MGESLADEIRTDFQEARKDRCIWRCKKISTKTLVTRNNDHEEGNGTPKDLQNLHDHLRGHSDGWHYFQCRENRGKEKMMCGQTQ